MYEFITLHLPTSLCAIGSICMFSYGLLFAIGKAKAACLISGFNSYSKEERKNYNTGQMSRDMRDLFFTLALILFLGMLLSLLHPLLSIPAYVLWIFRFVKEVHWDDTVAFEKYKLPTSVQRR